VVLTCIDVADAVATSRGRKFENMFHTSPNRRDQITPKEDAQQIGGTLGDVPDDVGILKLQLELQMKRLASIEDEMKQRYDRLRDEAVQHGMKLLDEEKARSNEMHGLMQMKIASLEEELQRTRKKLGKKCSEYEELLAMANELAVEHEGISAEHGKKTRIHDQCVQTSDLSDHTTISGDSLSVDEDHFTSQVTDEAQTRDGSVASNDDNARDKNQPQLTNKDRVCWYLDATHRNVTEMLTPRGTRACSILERSDCSNETLWKSFSSAFQWK